MTDRDMAAHLRESGWGVIPPEQYGIDMEDRFHSVWKCVESYTMTSRERGYALYKAVEYLCGNAISGDLVECGVWKGGSSMLMALALMDCSEASRHLFLYDTYEGMTAPTSEDVIAWNNKSVQAKLAEERKAGKDSFSSWSAGREEVEANMQSTGYPEDRVHYVAGDVCETLKTVVPRKISLLRLDTDWYASTVSELEYLYPRLVSGGILIIDDYGHFKGARQAVDGYFRKIKNFPYMSRIDYTGRVIVKP